MARYLDRMYVNCRKRQGLRRGPFPLPPRQTGRRVFPGTAFRRPSPVRLSVTVVVKTYLPDIP